MGDFHVTVQQMLYVVSVHVSTTFNSFCHEKCVLFKNSPVLLEYPDSFFLLIAATPLCYSPGLNTSEFLGVPALSDSTWFRRAVDSR
jgi:hypothetical protein